MFSGRKLQRSFQPGHEVPRLGLRSKPPWGYYTVSHLFPQSTLAFQTYFFYHKGEEME